MTPRSAEVRATYCAGGCDTLVPMEDSKYTLIRPNGRRVIKYVCGDCIATKPTTELFPLPGGRGDRRRRIERVEDPETLP